MEKLQQLLNFTDSNGEVITVFGGKMTLGQALMIAIVITGVVLALKLAKGVIRFVITGVLVCYCLVSFNIMSPDQLKDIAETVKSKGTKYYQTFAKESDNIKIDGTDIKVKLKKDWVSVSDIESIVSGKKGTLTVKTKNKKYVTDDSVVISLIKTFK